MLKFIAFFLAFSGLVAIGLHQFGDTLRCGASPGTCGTDWEPPIIDLSDEYAEYRKPAPGRPTIELGHDPMDHLLGRQRLSEVINERANK